MSHRNTLSVIIPLSVLLAGCGGGAELRGEFMPGTLDGDSVFAWVVGGPERVTVEDGRFKLRGVPAGEEPIDLRFSNGSESARMHLLGVDGSLAMSGVWVDGSSGLAFPSAVALDGDRVVLVNGLRFADLSAVPDPVEVEGEVLGAASGVLAVRPEDEALPDLFAVIDEATEVSDASGGSLSPGRLERGDRVLMEAARSGSRLRALRVVFLNGAPAPAVDDAPPPAARSEPPSILPILDDDGAEGGDDDDDEREEREEDEPEEDEDEARPPPRPGREDGRPRLPADEVDDWLEKQRERLREMRERARERRNPD